jgi:hypothetical protein
MPAEYQHNEVTGLIASVKSGKTPNNKDFWTVFLNGNEYTIWDSFLAQQADAYQQGGVQLKAAVRAKVDNGRVSKFWQILTLEPVQAGFPKSHPQPVVPLVADLSQGEVRKAAIGSDAAMRLELLHVAAEALHGQDTIADPNTIITYAETLEQYVLGSK